MLMDKKCKHLFRYEKYLELKEFIESFYEF